MRSYGTTADDGSLDYDWYPGYTYPSTGENPESGYYNHYAPGNVFGGRFIYGASPIVANQNISWFTAHTLDIGVDFQGWNGLFGSSVDYFDRRREGLFANRNGEVPAVSRYWRTQRERE